MQAAPLIDFSRDIYSVSRLNAEVRAVLDGSFPLLWVRGEVSNLAQPASGHIYFSLKDEASQVRCAMFRGKRRLLGFRPGNGQQVLVRARVGLYEPRGDYQLLVEHMEPAGEGALRVALEQLKRRLAAEGLFDEGAKRPLPAFPRQVGLITSASGAALHDLITVLGRRFALLPVLVYPAQVQGAGAVESLIQALTLANRRGDCDVLILARGGGSLEDLMAFNDEALVRAVRASAIPVVAGIGHETDLSLADLAADRRAATPSAAAELVAPDGERCRQQIVGLNDRLSGAQRRRQASAAERLGALGRQLRLLHPRARLQQRAQRVDELERRLTRAIETRIGDLQGRARRADGRLRAAPPLARVARARSRVNEVFGRLARSADLIIARRRQQLAAVAAGLQARSPLATLDRGYALVTTGPERRLLRDAQQVEPGARLSIRLARGQVQAEVVAIEPPAPPRAEIDSPSIQG